MSCILTTPHHTTPDHRDGDASHPISVLGTQNWPRGNNKADTDGLAGDHWGRQQNGEISRFSFQQYRDAVPAWERLHYLFHMGVTGELLNQPALQSFNYEVMSVWQAWSEAREE